MKKKSLIALICTAMLLSGCGQDKNTGADNVTGMPGENGGTQAPAASNENPGGSSSGTSNVRPDGSGPSDASSGGAGAPNGGAFGSGPSGDSSNPSGSSSVQAASAAVSSLSTERMFTDRDSRSTWDATAVAVSLLGSSAECASDKVSINGSTVTITGEGSYLLSGTLDDGMIIVDVDKKEKVQLVLNGVTIRNSDSAAVYVRSADKVFITLAAGTSNMLGNGGVYTAIDDNNIDAVIFSKDDLSLNGSGSLVVETAAGHGIVSKNDLVIAEGSYTINAASHGICGKDSVRIAGGSLAVTSGKDGIHADNDEDVSAGFVYIAGGTLQITAGGDGISASGELRVDGGDFTIVSGGGSASAPAHTGQDFRRDFGRQQASSSADTSSTKGLKSSGGLIINGGTFMIDSSDDALHSNTSLAVNGGSLSISAGDDGLHADGCAAVSAGTIRINTSYEGIEGQVIEISGGDIAICSSDDGLNAAGGSSGSAGGFGGFGGNPFQTESGTSLLISGGRLYVNAEGDGIDSNGTLTVTGGEIYVDGPQSSGNGALDSNGEAVITGGTIVAVGSSSMAETFGSSSTQGCILLNTASRYNAGTKVELLDASGSSLLEYTPSKSFNSVVVSCASLQKGSTYSVRIGSDTTEITMTDISYGSGNGFGGNRNPGQNVKPGGGRTDRGGKGDRNNQN
ncbi:MAG: carbohydrate-binding domain-containing protein, partial [Lachnospiraceae bacterium]|nr:carbohydrate-binding domain-containing protein [Lachnospiraceae bacterium]